MPACDSGFITNRGPIPLRIRNLDAAVGFSPHVVLANVFSRIDQISRVGAFVCNEYEIHLFERFDRLNRDVVRIPRADPNELQPSHASLSVEASAGLDAPAGFSAASSAWRIGTIWPIATSAGAAKFAARASPAMRSSRDTSTCSSAKVAEV